MKNPSKSIVAAITLIAFALTQFGMPSSFALPAELPLNVKIAAQFRLEIPSDLGTVERITSGSGPTLIHIQTAHGHYGAQKKIQGILHYLKNQYGIDLLLIEGSAFPLQPELLRFFPKQMDLTMEIADRLTRKALVKGSELFLLEEPTAKAYGIENLEAYRADRDAFKEVLLAQEKTSVFLRDMEAQIERFSSAYLNKNLRAHLKRLEAYEAKQVSLVDWLAELKAQALETSGIDLASPAFQLDWPMLVRLFKLQEFESKLDRNIYPKERTEFLSAIRRWAPKEITGQVEALLKVSATEQSLSDPETGLLFERLVESLPPNFSYRKFSNVCLAIGRLILQSEIKGDRLVAELDRLQDLVISKLAKTEEEKQTVELLKAYRLLKKLFVLELTAGEYEQIVEGKREEKQPVVIASGAQRSEAISRSGIASLPSVARNDGENLRPSILLNRFLSLNQSKRVRDLNFGHVAKIDELFDQALEFYRGAKARDKWMLENIEARLKETGARKAVVITGGFHTKPFQDFFEVAHYNYASVSPRIAETESREAYVQAILQSTSTPLTKATMEVDSLALPRNQIEAHGSDFAWINRALVGDIADGAASLNRLTGKTIMQFNDSAYVKTNQTPLPVFREGAISKAELLAAIEKPEVFVRSELRPKADAFGTSKYLGTGRSEVRSFPEMAELIQLYPNLPQSLREQTEVQLKELKAQLAQLEEKERKSSDRAKKRIAFDKSWLVSKIKSLEALLGRFQPDVSEQLESLKLTLSQLREDEKALLPPTDDAALERLQDVQASISQLTAEIDVLERASNRSETGRAELRASTAGQVSVTVFDQEGAPGRKVEVPFEARDGRKKVLNALGWDPQNVKTLRISHTRLNDSEPRSRRWGRNAGFPLRSGDQIYITPRPLDERPSQIQERVVESEAEAPRLGKWAKRVIDLEKKWASADFKASLSLELGGVETLYRSFLNVRDLEGALSSVKSLIWHKERSSKTGIPVTRQLIRDLEELLRHQNEMREGFSPKVVTRRPERQIENSGRRMPYQGQVNARAELRPKAYAFGTGRKLETGRSELRLNEGGEAEASSVRHQALNLLNQAQTLVPILWPSGNPEVMKQLARFSHSLEMGEIALETTAEILKKDFNLAVETQYCLKLVFRLEEIERVFEAQKLAVFSDSGASLATKQQESIKQFLLLIAGSPQTSLQDFSEDRILTPDETTGILVIGSSQDPKIDSLLKTLGFDELRGNVFLDLAKKLDRDLLSILSQLHSWPMLWALEGTRRFSRFRELMELDHPAIPELFDAESGPRFSPSSVRQMVEWLENAEGQVDGVFVMDRSTGTHAQFILRWDGREILFDSNDFVAPKALMEEEITSVLDSWVAQIEGAEIEVRGPIVHFYYRLASGKTQERIDLGEVNVLDLTGKRPDYLDNAPYRLAKIFQMLLAKTGRLKTPTDALPPAPDTLTAEEWLRTYSSRENDGTETVLEFALRSIGKKIKSVEPFGRVLTFNRTAQFRTATPRDLEPHWLANTLSIYWDDRTATGSREIFDINNLGKVVQWSRQSDGSFAPVKFREEDPSLVAIRNIRRYYYQTYADRPILLAASALGAFVIFPDRAVYPLSPRRLSGPSSQPKHVIHLSGPYKPEAYAFVAKAKSDRSELRTRVEVPLAAGNGSVSNFLQAQGVLSGQLRGSTITMQLKMGDRFSVTIPAEYTEPFAALDALLKQSEKVTSVAQLSGTITISSTQRLKAYGAAESASPRAELRSSPSGLQTAVVNEGEDSAEAQRTLAIVRGIVEGGEGRRLPPVKTVPMSAVRPENGSNLQLGMLDPGAISQSLIEKIARSVASEIKRKNAGAIGDSGNKAALRRQEKTQSSRETREKYEMRARKILESLRTMIDQGELVQNKVAVEIGIESGLMSRWLGQKQTPTPDSLQKIEQFMKDYREGKILPKSLKPSANLTLGKRRGKEQQPKIEERSELRAKGMKIPFDEEPEELAPIARPSKKSVTLQWRHLGALTVLQKGDSILLRGGDESYEFVEDLPRSKEVRIRPEDSLRNGIETVLRRDLTGGWYFRPMWNPSVEKKAKSALGSRAGVANRSELRSWNGHVITAGELRAGQVTYAMLKPEAVEILREEVLKRLETLKKSFTADLQPQGLTFLKTTSLEDLKKWTYGDLILAILKDLGFELVYQGAPQEFGETVPRFYRHVATGLPGVYGVIEKYMSDSAHHVVPLVLRQSSGDAIAALRKALGHWSGRDLGTIRNLIDLRYLGADGKVTTDATISPRLDLNGLHASDAPANVLREMQLAIPEKDLREIFPDLFFDPVRGYLEITNDAIKLNGHQVPLLKHMDPFTRGRRMVLSLKDLMTGTMKDVVYIEVSDPAHNGGRFIQFVDKRYKLDEKLGEPVNVLADDAPQKIKAILDPLIHEAVILSDLKMPMLSAPTVKKGEDETAAKMAAAAKAKAEEAARAVAEKVRADAARLAVEEQAKIDAALAKEEAARLAKEQQRVAEVATQRLEESTVRIPATASAAKPVVRPEQLPKLESNLFGVIAENYKRSGEKIVPWNKGTAPQDGNFWGFYSDKADGFVYEQEANFIWVKPDGYSMLVDGEGQESKDRIPLVGLAHNGIVLVILYDNRRGFQPPQDNSLVRFVAYQELEDKYKPENPDLPYQEVAMLPLERSELRAHSDVPVTPATMKVLIVEKEPMLGHLLKSTMKPLGVLEKNIKVVHRGDDFEAAIQTGQEYHLINLAGGLADGRDGLDILKALREKGVSIGRGTHGAFVVMRSALHGEDDAGPHADIVLNKKETPFRQFFDQALSAINDSDFRRKMNRVVDVAPSAERPGLLFGVPPEVALVALPAMLRENPETGLRSEVRVDFEALTKKTPSQLAEIAQSGLQGLWKLQEGGVLKTTRQLKALGTILQMIGDQQGNFQLTSKKGVEIAQSFQWIEDVHDFNDVVSGILAFGFLSNHHDAEAFEDFQSLGKEWRDVFNQIGAPEKSGVLIPSVFLGALTLGITGAYVGFSLLHGGQKGLPNLGIFWAAISPLVVATAILYTLSRSVSDRQKVVSYQFSRAKEKIRNQLPKDSIAVPPARAELRVEERSSDTAAVPSWSARGELRSQSKAMFSTESFLRRQPQKSLRHINVQTLPDSFRLSSQNAQTLAKEFGLPKKTSHRTTLLPVGDGRSELRGVQQEDRQEVARVRGIEWGKLEKAASYLDLRRAVDSEHGTGLLQAAASAYLRSLAKQVMDGDFVVPIEALRWESIILPPKDARSIVAKTAWAAFIKVNSDLNLRSEVRAVQLPVIPSGNVLTRAVRTVAEVFRSGILPLRFESAGVQTLIGWIRSLASAGEKVYSAALGVMSKPASETLRDESTVLPPEMTEATNFFSWLIQEAKLPRPGAGTAVLTTSGNFEQRLPVTILALKFFSKLAAGDRLGTYRNAMIFAGARALELKSGIAAASTELTAQEKSILARSVQFAPGHLNFSDYLSTLLRRQAVQDPSKVFVASATQDEMNIESVLNQMLGVVEDPAEFGMNRSNFEKAQAYLFRTLLLVDLAEKIHLNGETLRKQPGALAEFIHKYFEQRLPDVVIRVGKGGQFSLSLDLVARQLATWKQAYERSAQSA